MNSSPSRLKVFASPRTGTALDRRPEPEREAIRAALRSIPDAFGKPHLHAGLGLRQLRPGIYECRVGLDTRAIFERVPDGFVVKVIGSHDDVKAYLKNVGKPQKKKR